MNGRRAMIPEAAASRLAEASGRAVGRVVLGPDGKVTEADPGAADVLGAGGAGLSVLARILDESGLLPARGDAPGFRRSRDGRLEAAVVPAGDGWTLLVRAARTTADDPDAPALFLSIFAHELRTPLTSAKVALQLLARNGADASKSRELLAACERNVDRVVLLMGHAIDATALALGELRLDLETLAPEGLLERAAADAAQSTGRGDIGVARAAGPLPLVRADRRRVLQVLRELLDNAAKCTTAGSGIEIGAQAGADVVVVTVRDNGGGIPAELREVVFEPFRQVESSLTRKVGGLGLGLTIARGIVERHGGTIVVDDAPAGCSISFTLPRAPGDSVGMDLDLPKT